MAMHRVRQDAMELSDYIQDLRSWKSEVQKKDASLRARAQQRAHMVSCATDAIVPALHTEILLHLLCLSLSTGRSRPRK